MGSILNEKLTFFPQAKFITQKAFYMAKQLMPLLTTTSLDMRHNLWKTFIMPLFEFLVPLVSFEKSRIHIESIQTLIRRTFRNFALMARSTPKEFVDPILGYDIKKRSTMMAYISSKKWEARCRGEIYKTYEDTQYQDLMEANMDQVNKTKYLPAQLITYTNVLTACCPFCPKATCYLIHLQKKHNIHVKSPHDIVDHSIMIREDQKRRKRLGLKVLKRPEIQAAIKKICSANIIQVKMFIQNYI